MNNSNFALYLFKDLFSKYICALQNTFVLYHIVVFIIDLSVTYNIRLTAVWPAIFATLYSY